MSKAPLAMHHLDHSLLYGHAADSLGEYNLKRCAGSIDKVLTIFNNVVGAHYLCKYAYLILFLVTLK